MAKRTRYPGRPTGRRPGAKLAPASTAPKPSGLTAAELERAAALEAELVAREKAAIADNARRRARTRGIEVSLAGDATAPLSVRAAHEYAYVARDVKRIGITAIVMFGVLGALWVLVNLGGVGIP